MSLRIEEGDDFKNSLGKGLIIGSLGLAGIYGANMLKNFLLNKLYLEPSVYPKDHTFSFNVKQSSCTTDNLYEITNNEFKKEANVLSYYALGAGVPLGALATYQTLNYLGDVIHSLELKSKIRETEMALNEKEKSRAKKIREQEENQLWGNKLASAIDSSFKQTKEAKIKESNYKKMMEDPEIDRFIDINVYGLKKEAGVEDVVQFLTTDMLTKYLPITYGALSSLGAIAGYNYMRNKLKRPKEDVLNTPEIRYVINPRPDINSIDELAGVTVDKPIEKMSGLMDYVTDSASESIMQKLKDNPQYLLGAAGIGALATVPAMLYNRSQAAAVEEKLDKLIEEKAKEEPSAIGTTQQVPTIGATQQVPTIGAPQQNPNIIYISPESVKALQEKRLKKKAEEGDNSWWPERYLKNKLIEVGKEEIKKFTPHIVGTLAATALPGIGLGLHNMSKINDISKQVNDIRGSIKPPVQKSVANAFKMPTQKY